MEANQTEKQNTKMDNGNLLNPLVSIIVVTFNSSKYILETLESAKAQTYQNIELIISDDCSKDDTVNICLEWLEKNGKRFIKTEVITAHVNTGTAPNLNRGILASSGDWIKVFAGDDVLESDLLFNYVEYIRENPNAEVLHSKVIAYRDVFSEDNIIPSEDASNFKINKPGITPREQFEILLRASLIGSPTVMIKTSVFEKLGLFDERFPLWEDRPMFLKITNNNIKMYFLNIFGAKYRVRENSVARVRTTKKLISNFGIYKILAYKELCFPHLPPYERRIKNIVFQINLYFHSINNTNLLIRKLHKLLVTPLSYAVNNIDKKYR